jgi:dTDP-4-amino-4,6-dideoxygalactose transaminase
MFELQYESLIIDNKNEPWKIASIPWDAESFGFKVDNAHGLFGKYKGRYLGTFGQMSTLSFHETKNFTCGEGGALFLNEPDLVLRAEIIREKGTNRSQFFRGEVDEYSWIEIGSSYLPSDMLAGFLYAQIEERRHIIEHRRRIWHYYYNHLKDWASRNGVGLPFIPDYCEQSYHLFNMLMRTSEQQQRFLEHLKSKGILSVFHYLPLHLSRMGIQFEGHQANCPVSEDISSRLIRLPFYNKLSQEEQDIILDAIFLFEGC